MQSFKGKKPHLAEGVFIGAGVHLSGTVNIGRDSSVFYNSVVRGDVNSITIGIGTNIQDNCTLHVTSSDGLQIGDGVTVGHNAVLHGCTIGNNVLVGIGAIVLDGAIIQDDSLVAAGSLVTPGKKFPPGSLIMGSPAKVVRSFTEEEQLTNCQVARKYIKVQNSHAKEQEKA